MALWARPRSKSRRRLRPRRRRRHVAFVLGAGILIGSALLFDSFLTKVWHPMIDAQNSAQVELGRLIYADEHLQQINEFTYGMNPEVFAVVAYKTYLAKGAAKFVAQLLRAEVLPPATSHP